MLHKLAQTSLALAVALLALLSSVSQASWIRPPESPVERLIDFSQAYIDANPKDPRGYYMLGRVHSLAFKLQASVLRGGIGDADRGKLLPNVPVNPAIQRGSGKVPDEAALMQHLKSSIANYRKAVELLPTSGMSQLGFAYMLRTGARHADQLGLPPGDPLEGKTPAAAQLKAWEPTVKQLLSGNEQARQAAAKKLRASIDDAILLLTPHREHADKDARAEVGKLLTAYWEEQAIKAYLASYDASVKADAKLAMKVESNEDLQKLVSYEAAKGYAELVGSRGVKPAEQAKVTTCKLYVANLEKKAVAFMITPIIFSLKEPRAALTELLQPDGTAMFDLNGDGVMERWPWVKPTTGFLVWDPRQTGRITSGQQMFGSVTWWMFWENGYEPLAVLDADRDGELRGDELAGVGVWFDRNSNGVSDAGEVTPAGKLGIEALSVRATGTADDPFKSPMNARGLRMSDGREIATFDWVTRSCEPAK